MADTKNQVAAKNATDAKIDLVKLQAELAKLVAKKDKAAESVVKAETQLTAATEGEAKAKESLADAKSKLKEKEKAVKDGEKAKLEVAKMEKLTAAAATATEKVAKATEKAADAKTKIADKKTALKTAQKALADLEKQIIKQEAIIANGGVAPKAAAKKTAAPKEEVAATVEKDVKPAKAEKAVPAAKVEKAAPAAKAEKAPTVKAEKAAPAAKAEKAPTVKVEKAAPKAKQATGEVKAIQKAESNRLKNKYTNEVIDKMVKQFGYKNINQVPKLEKIVLNMGLGDVKDNAKSVQNAVEELTLIAGQKPLITQAKKSIANFKVRQGMNIGAKVTLRGTRMYEFMDKFVSIALPRVRDFRGISSKSFDGRGNYAMGVKEQLIFPEISYEQVEKVRGFDVCFVTTARSDEEAKALLTFMGMPFQN